MRWVPPEGCWPRLVAWACRHGVPGAKAYAGRRIVQEQDDDRMGAVLSTVWTTGKAVYATEDENGELVIRVMEEEP